MNSSINMKQVRNILVVFNTPYSDFLYYYDPVGNVNNVSSEYFLQQGHVFAETFIYDASDQLVSLLFLCSPKEKKQKEKALAAVEKNPVHYARQLAERRNPLRSHRSAPLSCYGKRIFSVTPQVGEITTEYAPLWQNGTLPKYAFNAKELDEETGMYYYEERYYKPPVFTSRDPMFEKNFWMTPYAYCANNPVKYVDPSGKEGEVSDLILADQTNKTNYTELLVSSLSKLTGISISTETRNNGRTFLTYAKDANGNPIVENDANGKPIGSQTAREMVIQLIDNKDIVNISRSGNGSAVPPNSNQIKLDFDQIERYMNGVQGGLNPETMGYGMVFLHEFSHTLIGGNMSDTPGTPGPVVEKINAIRAELNEQGGNYGQRMNYYSTLINGRNYLPFDVTSMKFLKIGQISGGCKYIEF